MNVYQMCINNVAAAIRAQKPDDSDPEPTLNAFRASEILAVAFCKSKEEVMADLLK